MAKDLALLGGTNPADDKDARKHGNINEGTGQVKALNTGHNETSLKKQLRSEIDAAWGGNRGLLQNLFGIFSGILATGGAVVGGVIAGAGEFFAGVIGGIQEFVGNIAQAIKVPKAGFEQITGAVDERLGPLDTAITENAKYFKELDARATVLDEKQAESIKQSEDCLLYTSPSPRDRQKSRMPSSA